MREEGAAFLPAGRVVVVAFEIERVGEGLAEQRFGVLFRVAQQGLHVARAEVEDDLSDPGLLGRARDEEALHVRSMHAHLQEVRDLRVGRANETPLIVDASVYGLFDDFPEWVEVDLGRAVEARRERGDELLFRGGIDDGEGHFLESAFEVLFEHPLEERGDLPAVIAEGPATPGAEDE